jgi:hypothetical protein
MARSLWDSLVSYAVSQLLLTVQAGAAARKWSLIVGGGVLWALVAWYAHPYTPGADPLRSFVDYPFRALFAADVFRHVLIAGLVFWVAFRVAAVYLDDIFELRNVEIAERFIRQAVFASRYDLIEIRDGQVAEYHKNSPIVQIGGPGNVRVYLENAALFEKIDGTPRVIPPTVRVRGDSTDLDRAGPRLAVRGRRRIFDRMRFPVEAQQNFPMDGVRNLEGFERLRTVIDLRDQFEENMEVAGRTRDGIQVKAENLHVIFSVYRGNREPTLAHPYPFVDDAVKSLVYEQSTTNWTAAVKTLINQELGGFISQHTLGEFLAAINLPEIEQQEQEVARLQQEANQAAGIDAPVPFETPPPPPPFAARPELSDLFYDLKAFTEQARKRGIELRWIGLGTWVTPDAIIPEQHQTAWRITRENLARGSEAALKQLFEESRVGELMVLVFDVPLGTFRGLNGKDETQRKDNMLVLVNAYRGKLRAALDSYEREGKAESPEGRKLRAALDHLAHVVYRWL